MTGDARMPGLWICAGEGGLLLQQHEDYAEGLDWTRDGVFFAGDRPLPLRGGTPPAMGDKGADGELWVVAESGKLVEVLKDPAGLVLLKPEHARLLLFLVLGSPLNATTQPGLDGGATPLALSWGQDVLVALFHNYTPRADFVSAVAGPRSKAREALWDMLRGHKMQAVTLPNTTVLHHDEGHLVAEYLRELTSVAKASMVIHSVVASHSASLGKGTAVTDSHLSGPWEIGARCLVAGISASFPHQVLPDETLLVQVFLSFFLLFLSVPSQFL